MDATSLNNLSIFLITVGGVFVGIMGLLCKYALKIKCDNITLCCGLIKCHRATELEIPDIESPDIIPPNQNSMNR